ncbi:GNAT family N-acetyltransferase [Eleftheria terrae]|uniref:GNAT family N-acetyltransferase n=1 Tax=Eleftheria terrae TaxID=1597781 RepID=UPI00263A6F72|nr:GNAT family N-acetyltransferase [Eleftheria terrae]WKB50627.1 GNAT family N-acetyltransferase [Eleftheria terrae]
MKIIKCGLEHLQSAAELFDNYRIFYEQASDPEGARAFIQANIEHDRSQIFLLLDDSGRAVAFSQLYPSYCSIAMKPFYYLSDLYVDKSARRHGYAKKLMEYLILYFGERAIQRLTLETATTNHAAQRLYESLGYEKEQVFITYHKIL